MQHYARVGSMMYRSYHVITRKSMSTSSRATDSLLRVYLHDALYSAEHGYLWNHVQKSLKKGPDGSPVPRPMINFGDLGSKWEYQKSIDDVLKETGASWLSPFELYNPWYGHALGKYILESHVGPAGISSNASGKGRAPRPDSPPPLQIFELGGGSGTVASNVLDYLKQVAPDVYATTTYTIINPRQDLLASQVSMVHLHHDEERIQHLVLDFANPDASGGDALASQDCFVIGLDLFDNLPRDKVKRNAEGELLAAVVHAEDDTSPPTERFCIDSAKDDLIATTMRFVDYHHDLDKHGDTIHARQTASDEALDIVPFDATRADLLTSIMSVLTPGAKKGINFSRGGVLRDGKPSFIPTGAVALFQHLKQLFPKHRLLASGFDHLPASTASLSAELKNVENAPLVSHSTGGDLGSYLLDPQKELGLTDIFFASDFALLQKVYQNVMTAEEQGEKKSVPHESRRTLALRSAEFATEHADIRQTALMNHNNYNPILEDFGNIQLLLGETQR